MSSSASPLRPPCSEAPHESQTLLVRETTGRLRAWFIPVRQGWRRLPEDGRWAPGAPCVQFVVDLIAIPGAEAGGHL